MFYTDRMTDLSLRPLERHHYHLVRHISVAPEQVVYSGTVQMAFESDEPGIDFHAVFDGAAAVGFFKIDLKYGDTQEFANAGDLGLRAFMIDEPHQGRGYGAAAATALGPYLRDLYPEAAAVVLTANLRNPPAVRTYLRAGFVDTGEIYAKGIAGPQHVMRKSLR